MNYSVAKKIAEKKSEFLSKFGVNQSDKKGREHYFSLGVNPKALNIIRMLLESNPGIKTIVSDTKIFMIPPNHVIGVCLPSQSAHSRREPTVAHLMFDNHEFLLL